MNIYFFAAYFVAWTFLFLLLVYLSRQQRQIGEDLKAFLDRGQKTFDPDQPSSLR